MDDGLRALAGGDLGGWPGLAPGLGRADLERAWGERPQAEGRVALFGSAAVLCRYPATESAPLGVQVWYVEGVASLVEIDEPVLPRPVEDLLGAPEAVVESLLGSSRTQFVYASRGLVIHVSAFTNQPYRLYGFEPCPVKQFLDAPLRWVSSTRIRR